MTLDSLKEFIRAMVRPLLALPSWAVVLVIALQGKPVPGELWTIAPTLTGFYFGQRGVSPPSPPPPA